MEQQKIGKKIGTGAQAKIYEWGEGRVVKLFGSSTPKTWTEYEYYFTKFAHDNALPVPDVYEIIEYNGQNGIVMERIEGKNIMQTISFKIWKGYYYAAMMADLQAKINAVKAPYEAMPVREMLRHWINSSDYAPQKTREAVLRILDRLPDGETICHMDIHPMNIIISANGPVIIDWPGASKGDPMADVARTWVLCSFPSTSRLLNQIVGGLLSNIELKYLQQYKTKADFNEEQYELWKIPNIAGRIAMERSKDNQRILLNVLEKKLEEFGGKRVESSLCGNDV